MLNRHLYDALKYAFGEVVIDKEDVPADIEHREGTLSDWDIIEGADHGEQYRVKCPFCDDHGHHLYISHMSYGSPIMGGAMMKKAGLLAHCFRRDCLRTKDNYKYLETMLGYALYSTRDGVDDSQIGVLLGDGIGVNQEPVADVGIPVSQKPTIEGFRTWVPDYQPIDSDTDKDVLAYLNERGVTLEDVERFHIGWGPIKSPTSGTYISNGAPWVLFPFVQHGKLVGLQARALPKFQDGNFKYWFHPKCRKATFIGNFDNAQALGIAVVCEGVFDALAVGRPGVCTFGHTPSSYQKMLLGSMDYGLIWLPDTDVREDLDTIEIARKQCEAWNVVGQFPKGAHVVTLPKKDAGDMSRQEIWSTIIQQVPDTMREHLLSRVVPNL